MKSLVIKMFRIFCFIEIFLAKMIILMYNIIQAINKLLDRYVSSLNI